MPDEILTLPEVAPLLKVADKTVHAMAQEGRGSGVQAREKWRLMRTATDRGSSCRGFPRAGEDRNDG